MDPLFEEEIMAEEEKKSFTMINPITFTLQFLATYGWMIVGCLAVVLYLSRRLRPLLAKWQQAREDAEYHKNPDMALARMEAVQRARELQQQKLLEASQRALEAQKEREERKRAEMAERLEKYGAATTGNRLGSGEKDDDYMPLSAGASTSSYRPPKKSKCGGGGCGR